MNILSHEVTVSGMRVELSAKEFALLATLAGDPDRVLTKRELLRQEWFAYPEKEGAGCPLGSGLSRRIAVRTVRGPRPAKIGFLAHDAHAMAGHQKRVLSASRKRAHVTRPRLACSSRSSTLPGVAGSSSRAPVCEGPARPAPWDSYRANAVRVLGGTVQIQV